MSCDSFDLDSISQLSLADSASTSVADLYKSASRADASLQPLPGLKSVSTDNIPNLELSYHGPRYDPQSSHSKLFLSVHIVLYPRSGFPHSFVRSKLSVLPEEQATLTRRRVRSVIIGQYH